MRYAPSDTRRLADATVDRPIRFDHSGHGFEIWAGMIEVTASGAWSERQVHANVRIDGVSSYRGPRMTGLETADQLRQCMTRWWDERHP